MKDRIKAVELACMGEENEGAIVERIKAAESAILGEYNTHTNLVERIRKLEKALGMM